jgi:hypothetical protein
VSALQAEVTRAREVAAAAEAGPVVAVLAAKTSAQEAAAAPDSTTIIIKDAENRAALAKREARERVSRMEAKSAMVLAFVREEAEGLVR